MSVASRVPFSDLCLICERVENSTRGKEDKQRHIRAFIHRWREYHQSLHKNDPNTTDSFYSAMRLLLPAYDKERGAYGIKEVKLAKYYIELLCLSKESKDAQSLLKYRSPSKTKGDSGDFATTAYYVLKNRCPEKGSLTVEEVNKSLDAIALSNAENKSSDVKKNLMTLLKNTTAIEQKWLIRMIMKQLKFGVSEQTILGLFHPDAQDLYDVNNSLSKVCQKLHDPNVRLHEIDVSLFSPFRPMLAEVANPNKVEKLMNQNKFYAETKHDGERMQLHMDKKKYMYFSRSGNDYSANFGSNPNDGSLTKYIHNTFSEKVKSCILDGEMIGYNSRNNCVITKGENMDVKALKDGNEYQPCFYAFDILMLNDKILSNLPLRERLTYLEGIFTPSEGRIQYTSRTEISSKFQHGFWHISAFGQTMDGFMYANLCMPPPMEYQHSQNGIYSSLKNLGLSKLGPSTSDYDEYDQSANTKVMEGDRQEAIDVLNNAIDNREEGVVVKNPDSIYKLNSRKAGWYKLKPEYVDGLMDNLDLLIVGGYFGEGRRRGLISHFMLGVALPPENPGAHPTVFQSFGRVGSGYSLKELYELCMKLNEHWKPYERRNPPDCLLIGSGHKERPDLWIEPAKSYVVQVKAAEIVKSDKFMTGCTLRFPRVETVRYDKHWHECVTLTQLDELRQLAEGKLATKHMLDATEDDDPSPKKKRTVVRMERPVALAPHFKGVDVSTVKQVDEVFTGHEMYVINGPPTHSKQALEKLILEFGGTIVQNPGPNTFCVLADKSGIKVQNIIKAKIYDVVKTDWLLRCIEEKQLLEWIPQDMMHKSADTLEKFQDNYDRFGDSYTEPSTEASLRYAFDEVERQGCIPTLNNDDIAELELEYFSNISLYGIFRTCRAYFDRYEDINECSTYISRSSLELTELQFLFYGGSKSDVIDAKTTHVIVHSSDLRRLDKLRMLNRERLRKFHIVTEAWVKQCVQKESILTERPFSP